MQDSRFKSDLNPGRGSWIAVVFVYLVGALLALVLFLCASSFVHLDNERAQFERLSNQRNELDRLVADLGHAAGADEREAARDRFDRAYRPLVDVGANAELLESVASGAGIAEVVDLVEEERAHLVLEQAISAERTRTFASQTKSRFLLLAVMVMIGVFGGGLLFLDRYRHLEGLLLRRAEELEEVDSSRRLFFAKASHELRTPVTAIRGEAEVAMSDGEDVATLREALRHVNAHARFLDHRIEEMIGLARTSDGKMHLVSERVDLRDVTQDAVREARAFATSVEVEVDLTLPDKSVEMTGDADWLKRAILTILENALKFSPMEGRVSVTLERTDGSAKVTVRDQGPGVMPEELPLIFDAYYQTEQGKMRGGTGLGLAMTRWVAEQHGGRAYARNIGSWQAPLGCEVTMVVALDRVA